MIPDLTDARATAAATLTCVCVIRRVDRSGPVTIDPDTLARVTPPDLTVWTGPCSVSPSGLGDTDSSTGAKQSRLDTYKVRVPVTATGILNGDTLTVTAVDQQGDPELVGRPLVVDSVDRRTTIALRRLTCVEPGPADGVPV